MSTNIAGQVTYMDQVELGHWYQIADSHTDKRLLDFTVYVRRVIPAFPAFMQVSYFNDFNPVIPDPMPGVDWHFDYSDKWRMYYTIQFGPMQEHYKLLGFTDTAEEGFEICGDYLSQLETKLNKVLQPETTVRPLDVTLAVFGCSDEILLLPESARPIYEYYQRLDASDKQ